MNVFISWSGSSSRGVALALKEWLPGVVQVVRPFMSAEDLEKGTRWASKVAEELEQSDFGILCVTRHNVDSPWLHFDAGALSKKIDRARVVPLLLDLPQDRLRCSRQRRRKGRTCSA